VTARSTAAWTIACDRPGCDAEVYDYAGSATSVADAYEDARNDGWAIHPDRGDFCPEHNWYDFQKDWHYPIVTWEDDLAAIERDFRNNAAWRLNRVVPKVIERQRRQVLGFDAATGDVVYAGDEFGRIILDQSGRIPMLRQEFAFGLRVKLDQQRGAIFLNGPVA